jgi:hypothetical protein
MQTAEECIIQISSNYFRLGLSNLIYILSGTDNSGNISLDATLFTNQKVAKADM